MYMDMFEMIPEHNKGLSPFREKKLYKIVYTKRKEIQLTEASIHQTKLNDITNWGIRASIGVIFIVQGSGKFGPGFVSMLENIGLPVEMQIPIALAEVISGILLIVGVLTRISASMIAIIMLGAILYVKHATNLTGNGGYALDLILLAGALVVITAGPGRLSFAHIIKKLPRCLH
jgi:putative oxidoreductase